MQGWAELNLEQRASLVWAAAGIAVCGLIAYATVRQIQMAKKIGKRMHLDDEGGLA